MARPTIEQKDAIIALERDYGPASQVKLEYTMAAYGIIWMHWAGREVVHVGAVSANRNLFIKPDGTRLSWEIYTIKPAPDEYGTLEPTT